MATPIEDIIAQMQREARKVKQSNDRIGTIAQVLADLPYDTHIVVWENCGPQGKVYMACAGNLREWFGNVFCHLDYNRGFGEYRLEIRVPIKKKLIAKRRKE